MSGHHQPNIKHSEVNMKKGLIFIMLIYIAIFLAGCSTEMNRTDTDMKSKGEEISMRENQSNNEIYTAETRISDVINDPVFRNYGGLIFPVDSGYYSGDTLDELRLTWYSHIDPNKTIEIANYMKSHALELSKKGYNAFALIYRPGAQTACEDLARAIAFIFEHADELEVNTDCYSLWGGSAGGRMTAYLSSYGTQSFGEASYPGLGTAVIQYTGHREYTKSDPPTFMCVGENDGIASWRTMEKRANAMKSVGIDTEFHKYPGLGHGFGIGTGTAAEGWLDDAVSFWEKQM